MPIEAAPTVRESLEKTMESFPEDIPSPAPVETPAPTSEAQPPAEVTPAAQETSAEQRARDEKGQFTKQQKADAKAAIPAPVKIQRPSSWKKELEAEWETLPPPVQQNILEREKQYQTGVSAYKTERDTLANEVKPLQEAIAPYRDILANFKVDPAQHVGELLRSHHTLVMGSPQDKAALVGRIIQQNNIPLEMLLVKDAQGNIFWNQQFARAPQAQAPQQPQIKPEDIDARIQQAFLQNRVNEQFDTFSKAVTEGKHPHYEAVKQTMAKLLETGFASDYPSAYEIALGMPEHRSLAQAAPQAPQPAANAAAAEKAKVERARSQAVSVKSSTPSAMAQTHGNKSIRDSLEGSFDKVVGGQRV